MDHTQQTGAAIRLTRGERSAQWLSDRTSDLGHKVSRSTIADIENGRRKYLSTAELSVIAWALDVPPVQLLYPTMPDGETEIVPGVVVPAITAAMWFSGEWSNRPKVPTKDDVSEKEWRELAQRSEEIRQAGKQVALSRERLSLMRRAEAVVKFLDGGRNQLNDELLGQVATIREDIARIEDELRSIDGAVVDG